MPKTTISPSGIAQAIEPHDAIAGWPAGASLAALTAGAGQWTLLASPAGIRQIRSPADLEMLLSPRIDAGKAVSACKDLPPFRAGRVIVLAYPLGAALEPAVGGVKTADGAVGMKILRDEPLGFVLDIPGVLAHNRAAGTWVGIGKAPGLPAPSARAESFRVGPLVGTPGREEYQGMVRRGLDAIAAGDVYQVNLAHRLSVRFEGSPRAFFAALVRSARPLHGAYVEIPAMCGRGVPEPFYADGVAICSASPELFLRYEAATRRVTTRPMKGTRPITADPDELRSAEKDRAELNMITDLMRNDLGRVCEFGSVRVDTPRSIEAHGRSVLQATSTISGTLRTGLSHADLIAATFPPGSVTGTPKIRAMQLIEQLEPTPRGFYCGAIGWLDDSGDMELNVAIRTAVVAKGELHYHVGAGIVADSHPEAEWSETLDKAELLKRSLGQGSRL